MLYSVKINDIHMLKEYGLYLEHMDCVQPPEPYVYSLSVPGKNGKIDLSDTMAGYPTYKNRLITLTFAGKRKYTEWPTILSKLMTAYHNKRVKLIFDDDTAYYYMGRANITNQERALSIGEITIEVDADPYKYDLISSLDDWLWDEFDFETGIIREYKELTVQGKRDLVIIGSPKDVVPTIICSTAMTVTWKGKTYNMKAGKNKLYAITIPDGEHTLTFSGNGIVSVDYRGGIL